jgi:hypothetical protein
MLSNPVGCRSKLLEGTLSVVGGGKVVEEQWDVRFTRSLPTPSCLGDFLAERRGALPPLGPSVQDTPRIPHTDRPTSGFRVATKF